MIPVETIYAAIFTQLENAGIGKTGGPWAATETALAAKRSPAKPDRAVVVTVYDRQENPNPKLPDEAVRFQVRCRAAVGNVLDADRMAEAVKAALEGDHMTWAGLTAHKCRRASYAPIGADANGRDETSSNFDLLLNTTEGA